MRGDPWLFLSSLGTGTYLGAADKETDEAVAAAIVLAVHRGWNVIDTASNYRDGHGEVQLCAPDGRADSAPDDCVASILLLVLPSADAC